MLEDSLQFYLELSTWHWLAFAILLIGIEVFAPSTFLLGPAAAAFVVGIALLFIPILPLSAQLALFAIAAVGFTLAIRRWVRDHPSKIDKPLLNQRTKQLIGRRTTLIEDMDNGRGRVTMNDTSWLARAENGDNIRAGTAVEVINAEGTTLIVRRITDQG